MSTRLAGVDTLSGLRTVSTYYLNVDKITIYRHVSQLTNIKANTAWFAVAEMTSDVLNALWLGVQATRRLAASTISTGFKSS